MKAYISFRILLSGLNWVLQPVDAIISHLETARNPRFKHGLKPETAFEGPPTSTTPNRRSPWCSTGGAPTALWTCSPAAISSLPQRCHHNPTSAPLAAAPPTAATSTVPCRGRWCPTRSGTPCGSRRSSGTRGIGQCWRTPRPVARRLQRLLDRWYRAIDRHVLRFQA